MVIKVKQALLKKAFDELELKKSDLEIIHTKQNENLPIVEIDCNKISISLLSFFLKNSLDDSNKTQEKQKPELILDEMNSSDEDIWETRIHKLPDIIECFSKIGVKKINSDIFFNKKWYPVIANPSFIPASRNFKAHVVVYVRVCFVNEYIDLGFTIEQNHLVNIDGKMRKPKLKELLSEFGCRPQTCDLSDHNASLQLAEKLMQSKKQLHHKGYGLVFSKIYSYKKFTSKLMGYENLKDRVIIEPELEYNDETVRAKEVNKSHYTKFPIIRVFSFVQKQYAFVDVNNLEDYKYDLEAHNRIFLPEKIKNLLTIVFSTSIDSLVGDIVENKHGGMIILAYGNPGIGKTSTAEVFSEMKQMPLYSIDIAEIGTRVDDIEKNLNIIFRRVEHWNAIVLFDEIDVFLAKREKNDLNRSAIVGVFLRLMDYFKGVMFMTSNRPEVLDYAISSRITLKVKYPDLDEIVRKKIWQEKLNRAAIKFKGDLTNIAQVKLNGREIRNIIRLAKIMYPKSVVESDLMNLIEMTTFQLNEQ